MSSPHPEPNRIPRSDIKFRILLYRIPVILYDQIGNGQSSHKRDASSDFWTPRLFIEELDNLVKKLEISDDFDLLGQSWGGAASVFGSSHLLI
jgi:pimeloyl-ACP methyl ester carboxylesterase